MGYASLWKRGGALLVDFLAVIILFYTLLLTNLFESRLLFSLYLYLAFLSHFIYFIALETIYGQTLGKMLFKIRVVGKNGKKAVFWQCLSRNLLRVVDVLPLFYLIGISSILLTKKKQRLGDFVAGTIVVDKLEK